jgi:hypothetical protein
MLTNPSTLKTIGKLLSVCSLFGTYNKNISSEVHGAGGAQKHAATKKFESSIAVRRPNFAFRGAHFLLTQFCSVGFNMLECGA